MANTLLYEGMVMKHWLIVALGKKKRKDRLAEPRNTA